MADQSGSKWMFWLIQGQLSKTSFNLMAHEHYRQPIQDLTPIFSFLDAMYDMVNSNSVILYAGGIFMVAFVCSVMGKFNALEQRVIFRKKSLKQAFSISFSLCFSDCVVFLWPDGDRSVSSLLFWSLLLLQALLNANATNGSILVVGNWRGRYICHC